MSKLHNSILTMIKKDMKYDPTHNKIRLAVWEATQNIKHLEDELVKCIQDEVKPNLFNIEKACKVSFTEIVNKSTDIGTVLFDDIHNLNSREEVAWNEYFHAMYEIVVPANLTNIGLESVYDIVDKSNHYDIIKEPNMNLPDKFVNLYNMFEDFRYEHKLVANAINLNRLTKKVTKFRSRVNYAYQEDKKYKNIIMDRLCTYYKIVDWANI